MPDMLSVPAAPQAPPGPQESASAPPGREPEGPPFKDVLDHHQARTADAEGRSGGDDSPKGKDSKDDAGCSPQAAVQALALVAAPVVPVTTPPVTVPGAEAASDATATAGTTPATALVAATAVADLAPAAAAQLAGVPAQQAAPEATAAAPVTEAGATPVPTQAPANDVTSPADVTSVEVPQAAVPADRPATRSGDAPATGAPAPAQPAAAAAPVPDAQAPAAAIQPVGDNAAAAAPVASAQPAAAQAATQAPERDDAPAGPQAPQSPVVAHAVEHAHRATPVAPPAPVSPLNTAHAVERIQAMVHVAHARGVAHARVELHPAELGGVTIQLHVAHDGLRAHVTADRADALPLLQRAAADLQRTLENRGIDLAGLDFGLAPDAEAGASRDDGRAQQRGNAFGTTRDSDGEPDGDDDVLVTSPPGPTRAVGLPAGALVDVRA